ncbi:MAG TPA: MFS transporter [Terriglobales bacterium]|nr:MFS transporter [Terriglobales bacterium]
MRVPAPPSEAPPPTARRALARLAVAVLLAMAPWFTTAALVGPLRTAWQLSPAGAAWLTIAAQIGFVAGALVSALLNLADLIAPRRLMLFGGLAAAATNAALAGCHRFGAAWPWRFATGACLALVYPPALKLLATWYRRGRGTALGIVVGALTVGSALPHLVNALGGADWRVVVLATSAITALGGIWGGWAGQEGPYPFARARFDPREIGKVMANPGMRLATVGYVGHMWELIAMWSWIGPFLTEAFGRAGGSASAAALATFVAIGVGGAGCWCGGVLSDRSSRTGSIALALAISGTCSLGLGWLRPSTGWGLAGLLAGVLVWGFWVVADSAQFSTLVTEWCDPRYVGTALTTQTGLGFILAAVTVWLMPWIRAHGGWGWAFAALAPGPLVGLAAMARLRRLPPPAPSA